MTVADRIKMRRLELEWSQEELAKRAGYYGKPTVSKYENAGNDISMKQVARMAKALGVTTAYLMGWETTADQIQAPTKTPDTAIIKSENSVIDANDIPKAVDLYSKYMNVSPEIQAAVDLLLKSSKPDSSLPHSQEGTN